ncbi:hypothetical protein BGZ57DRAFT_492112 [Hyaloscypha finlandica]|nr:hypothetical protein BGZ57DRAFT_492112 [Hyaloscypha finlandica]
MESPNSEHQAGLKRKRSPVPSAGGEEGRLAAASAAGVPKTGVGNVTQINYLVRAKAERLRLIEGDGETFANVLGMIDDYEGVLQRHESLAANLGAKLVGPLLLKSFEKLFDGPIKITSPSFGLDQSPVSWLDIVTFSRTNPAEFVLSESNPGARACRFWIKGGQVEITEDDYRLIQSGAPERMIPTQPIPEDETAELGTLNILENRLTMLIKKADAVASKARQLNYHLKGRKAAVLSRKAADLPVTDEISSQHFSPQPFSAVNTRSSIPPNGEPAKIQQQLLEQFLSDERRPSTSQPRPKASRISTDAGFHTFNGQEVDSRRMSHPLTPSEDGTEGQYRILMASKIEKLSRGEAIYPPCDRCRRLKFDCTKHLTACQACTKKHAKCSWKDIKEGELDYVPQLSATFQQPHSVGSENGQAHADHIDPGLSTGVMAEGPGVAMMISQDNAYCCCREWPMKDGVTMMDGLPVV